MGIYDREYYREDALNLQPNWNGRSAISYLLILNVAIYVCNIIMSDFRLNQQGVINSFLMLYSSDAYHPLNWWRTLTYAFVHDAGPNLGVWHILMNMMALYFLGRSVEEKYGRSEFLKIYLISAVFCSVVWLAKTYLLKSNSALFGASGAVSCICILFVLNFPKQIVYLFVFPVPAWVLGVFLILSNLASTSSNNLSEGVSSTVANDVHLTGILFGVAYFFLKLNFSFLNDINGSLRRNKRRWFGPKLRLRSDDGDEFVDDSEADRILAKIHEQGKDSLTSRERKFMEKYSRRVRQRKQEQ